MDIICSLATIWYFVRMYSSVNLLMKFLQIKISWIGVLAKNQHKHKFFELLEWLGPNPITAMVFWAMFTFQPNNTKM